MDLHFFDPNETASIIERRLPHWCQAGVVCFVTFRTHDSMPVKIVDRWCADRRNWLRQQSINPESSIWRSQLAALSKEQQEEFYSTFSTRWHNELDYCHGNCVLRDPVNAQLVADALIRFNEDRYLLTDFVVMPNHVHMLIAFADDDSMLKQCEDWKRFTARQIHRRMGTSGRFWQQDGFDHLVRSEAQYAHFRRYIAENPNKAGLKPGEYIHFSKSSSLSQ